MGITWKQFTKKIPVRAPAKAIYEAWATRQGLESWFLREAVFTRADGSARSRSSPVEAGDHYLWRWHGYHDDVKEEREILQANGWDKLVFRFSGDCIVTVTILQEAGETICQLVQEMPMEDTSQQQHYYIECGSGWAFYLVNLKSVLEGGIDLRNRKTELTGVVNS